MLRQPVLRASLALLPCLLLTAQAALAQVPHPDLSKYLLSQPKVLFTKRVVPPNASPNSSYASPNPSPQELSNFYMWLRRTKVPIGALHEVRPFFVAPDGTFYRLRGNRFICQFDRTGKLIRAIRIHDGISGGHYDLRCFAVDRQGRIFLQNFAGVPGPYEYLETPIAPILVFDPQGRRLTDLEQRIEAAIEQITEHYRKRGATHGWWALGEILVDKLERLHLCKLWLHAIIDLRTGKWEVFNDHGVMCYPREDGTSYSWSLLEQGDVISVRYYNSEGKVVETRETKEDFRYQVVIYGQDGKPVRQYLVPREQTEVERLLPYRVGFLGIDGRGHAYILRMPQVVERFSLGGFAHLLGGLRYVAVCEYDAEGRSLGIRAVYENVGLDPILDEAGNLYWTAFEVFGSELGEQFVHLLMSPVPQSTR